ncbi:MAG: DUF1846 domain-containing protein [Clostridiales bacterium]|nr:DUF1846 domain-containing protein [Clostridiales bacterium]
MKIGFDQEKYLKEQTQYILERVDNNHKLYLEFGGKLFSDYHAARVLPGFDVNAKVKLLKQLKDKTEIIICVYAGDIEKNKIRADYGITYDMDVLRLIDELRALELDVNSVVITRYQKQPSAKIFIEKLKRRGIKTYKHKFTKGYPTDVDTIVSKNGYGANPYIETTKPLVVVTAPGPGSGKLATCLSQLYHENKRNIQAGYSKFETFPIWNLPLNHPVNTAYESATVDLKDVNQIDYYHLEAYGEKTVNYNRDLEAFPVLKRILEKITGEESIYKSPTDMGVNRAGFGITNDEVVQNAAKQEIIRRYFKSYSEYKKGHIDLETAQRAELIMKRVDLTPEERVVVKPARKKAGKKIGTALQLHDGSIVTARGSHLINPSAALILNAIKVLSHIPDKLDLISPSIFETVIQFKKTILNNKNPQLNIEEVLIALSISSNTNPTSKLAYEKLLELKNCEVHSTVILSQMDESMFRRLGINFTCDAQFATKDLFYI